MEILQTLGTVLGLTAMAGVNLYLTVFVTGLAIHLGWLTLAPGLQDLQILANPAVLVVAGVLLVIEFIVDKTPYADSAWDTIHTIIRPIGGALLALGALGQMDPVVGVVAGLLGGTVALSAHSVKAGTRLMINLSPEPISNIAASVGEDAIVLGGIYLAFAHPLIAACLVTVFLVTFWYFAPKFFRFTRANLVGILDYLRAKRRANAVTALPSSLPEYARESWLMRNGGTDIAWVVPCFSGKMQPIGAHVCGCLVATADQRAFFIGRKNFRTRIVEIPLKNVRIEDEPGRIFHRVIVHGPAGEMWRLRFTRRYAGLVPQIAERLRGPATAIQDPRFELATAM